MATMNITNMNFSKAEAAAIYALAGAALLEQGKSRKEALAYIAGLTPQNVLRLALGLPLRQRGGLRPNNGRRDCARCGRIWSDKVKAFGEGLCSDCWHELADAKSAM